MSSAGFVPGVSERSRDSYGFEVKKEYEKLYSKYAPLWDKEEEERRQRWSDFLEGFQGGDATELREHRGDSEAALEAALNQLQESDQQKEDLSWWRQLSTLVQAGVPMSLRGRLWRTFLQTKSKRAPGVYDALVSQALAPQYQNSKKLEEAMPSVDLGPKEAEPVGKTLAGAYQEAGAVKPPQASSDGDAGQDWTVQIEKDLHRTFPGHPVMDRSGRRSLRRILAAYACRNPSVGYCQGMNFVAGCLLLFMEEEDAFWCLTVIVEQLLLGYFSTTMVAPQVDQLVFKRLVDKQFPRLTGHLDKLGVNVASVSTQWFLCVFVNSLPLETCLRVWDLFLFERCSAVLFRVALALVDIYAQALVATVDSVDAFSLLQNMAPLSFDSSRLVDVACIAYAHVDHQHMEALRRDFEHSVNAQVQERLNRRSRRKEAMEIVPEGENEDEAGPSYEEDLAIPGTARFLPRIQVASPRSAESSSLRYNWRTAEIPLHIASSKAAATAYKIASSPAASSEAGQALREGPGAQDSDEEALRELGGFPEDKRGVHQLAPSTSHLDNQVHEVLDRRKQGLLESASMSNEEREGVLTQLMDLVSRLEEERFQVEARRFETENKASMLLTEMDNLRAALQSKADASAEKRAVLAALQERHRSESATVTDGGRRYLQHSTTLRNAEANRALRASLLSEKQELIQGLQQELGQASTQSRSKLLQKFRLTGWSK